MIFLIVLSFSFRTLLVVFAHLTSSGKNDFFDFSSVFSVNGCFFSSFNWMILFLRQSIFISFALFLAFDFYFTILSGDFFFLMAVKNIYLVFYLYHPQEIYIHYFYQLICLYDFGWFSIIEIHLYICQSWIYICCIMKHAYWVIFWGKCLNSFEENSMLSSWIFNYIYNDNVPCKYVLLSYYTNTNN